MTPDLAQLAIKVLSQPCGAGAAEQSWAQYEYIHSKRRNRLSRGRASDLLYVSANLKLLQKIQSGEQFKVIEITDADLYDLGNSDDEESEGSDFFEVSDNEDSQAHE
jgi:hypothetical protein